MRSHQSIAHINGLINSITQREHIEERDMKRKGMEKLSAVVVESELASEPGNAGLRVSAESQVKSSLVSIHICY